MASVTSSSPTKPQLISTPYLDVPDEEHQRGRKRRRSSAASQPAQLPSNGIRGRGRRRSLSLSQNQSQDSSHQHRSASPDRTLPKNERKSPGRKYQRKYLEVAREKKKKKRSQSPSRSRSFGHEGDTKPRRRQRTHSRSRSHGKGNRKTEEHEDGSIKKVELEVTQLADDVAVED